MKLLCLRSCAGVPTCPEEEQVGQTFVVEHCQEPEGARLRSVKISWDTSGDSHAS
jgi:hypothetical protein